MLNPFPVYLGWAFAYIGKCNTSVQEDLSRMLQTVSVLACNSVQREGISKLKLPLLFQVHHDANLTKAQSGKNQTVCEKHAATPSQNVSTATLAFPEILRNLALQGFCCEGDDTENSVLSLTNLNVDTTSCFSKQLSLAGSFSSLAMASRLSDLALLGVFFYHVMQTVLW